MGVDPTFGLAFIAGFVSFVSPCVLPLVPAYIGYMGGRMTKTVSSQIAVSGNAAISERSWTTRFSTFLHGVAFVAGFTLVFVVLGLFISSLASIATVITDIIGRIGGIIIIFFGLHFMGVMPNIFRRLRAGVKTTTINGQTHYEGGLLGNLGASIVLTALGGLIIWWGFVEPIIALPVLAVFALALLLGGAFTHPGTFWVKIINTLETALYSDTRKEMTANGKGGLGGSFFMGIVFSAGWTPCIGPIYGAVLTMAASEGNIGAAAPLLIAYSLGLGIPFLLTALLLDSAQGVLRRLQKRMHTIELISGTLLILIGITVATGSLQALSGDFAARFQDVSTRVELCTVGFFEGEVPLNHLGPCYGGSITPMEVGAIAVGNLNGPDWELSYTFHAEAGQPIDIRLNRVSQAVIPKLALISPDGTILDTETYTEPIPTGETVTPFSFTAETTGLYMVTVKNMQEWVGTEVIEEVSEDGSTQTRERTILYNFNLRILERDEDASTDTGNSTGAAEAVIETAINNQDTSNLEIGLEEGQLAPDFETVTDGGETVRLSDFRGQVVLLNFWGTWCGPCRREMPLLQELFENKQEENFTILAVSARDTVQQVQDFRAEFGLTFTLAMDEDEAISQGIYAIPGQPATFIIDENGVITARHFGILVESQIDDLLATAQPS
ncbi:MAG: hypothetical protein D6712_01615 [Chloroflexi bacterium]|nr:MAG: hypothetical protein D6712_01615 [Chloroflexota bacterium]